MSVAERLILNPDGNIYRVLEKDLNIAIGDKVRVMGIDPEFVVKSGSTLNPADVESRRGLGTYGTVTGIKKMEQGFMGGVPDAYLVRHPGSKNLAAYAHKELSKVSEDEYQQAEKRRAAY